MSAILSAAELAPLPLRKSLRTKGFFATMALLAYLFGSLVYVTTERAKVDQSIQALQHLSRHEKAIALAQAAVTGAVVEVNQATHPELVIPREVTLYIASCAKLFAALEEFDPSYALLERSIARSYASMVAAPSRPNWIDLHAVLARASDELEIRHRSLAERRIGLTLAYQRQYDAVTVQSLLLALAGIAVLGALVAWFFARLTGDIRQLESHARQIVHGSRGVVLPVQREDELGRLMHAVNRMSADLDQREKQIELDGERRSHQDKMMAVGALAAGVAHEVNNPLTVIAGIAQELAAIEDGVPAQRIRETARQILSQTQRAAQAARNLAELAALQPNEFDWVDVNAMVRRVLQLMGYDKRYRHIGFESDLAMDVPAVLAPGAAVQQVLMQMMSLGCDLMPALPRGEVPVRVLTRSESGYVEVQLAFPVRLDFTRAQVQRVLVLNRAMIEPLHARLALSQEDGPLLRITLAWPTDPGSA